MDKKKILIVSMLGGVAAFGYFLYAYAKKQAELLAKYDYKIVGFKIDNFDLQMIKGSISINFGSKSDVEVKIEQFILDFYFNGQKVGYLEDTTPFVIPAKGSTVIPFSYTLNPQLILGNVADIVAYAFRKKDASISVRGYAKLKSGFVKATLPISYDTTIKEILSE